ncbi:MULTISPECIES: YetF domain-containing protein [unclassified Caballeronia]|uniref:YetF domain-containing protein n=1 Tax=unclassified Caballeronia TaxID=2646786 RepID=UPI00285E8A80|nr:MULTISPECIES: YetF domain-containing protein [unclassified Caballeronia]MDR5777456.1 DUF421 domain-containing protein [Caballeronia sp. LZ002]MDR5852894.1 DUF421 domain-containing protein [Caballeronia sp. LZ003]
MASRPFSLTDWHRFLFGNASWNFLLEVLLRTGVTYVLLVIAMRLLGRRVAAQYTLFEISIVVTLAAAIGVPLQAANRGMLPPLVIALVAIGLQRLIAKAGINYRQVETMVATDVTPLVREGRLEAAELKLAAVPREKIYEVMRLAGWQHLGQVSRLYMEPSGSFSFIPARPAKPGLSVLPEIDEELRNEARVDGYRACLNCGNTVRETQAEEFSCSHCGALAWTYAVTEVERR